MTYEQSAPSHGARVSALAVSLLLVGCGIATAQGASPTQLRRFIDTQSGGIQKLMYSVYRPDLVAAGDSDGRPAVDGRPLSSLPQDNNDALSRRDMGLEFLDVTNRVNVALIAT
jgi:hypothetical protein